MSKCIRCGKPCADGENMCDDCKAWFREKTGGELPKKKNERKAKDSGSSKLDSDSAASDKNESNDIKESEKMASDEQQEPDKKKVKLGNAPLSGGPNKLILIIAGVVLAVVIVTAFILLNKNNREAGEVSSKAEETNVGDASTDAGENAEPTVEPTAEPTVEPTVVPETPQNISISAIEATSCLSEYDMTHSADRIHDGTLEQAWVEGAEGQGIGESVTVYFDDYYVIHNLIINAGYQKSEELYYKNSRPHILKVYYSDGGTELIELADFYGTQNIALSYGAATDSIELEIESVYEGNKYQDTVISEVDFN